MYSTIGIPMLLALSIAAAIVPDTNPPSPAPPVPDARQLAWHSLGYYAFVHFNMNTFTGREWGEGYEDPKQFNPTALDCRQWVRTFKAAGMKAVIITAKHHDGFCLWPSKYTEHSVKNSPWRGGKGDVLRELSDACRDYGLKMGVYLSPWDRNHPDYGKGEAYNRYFINQLTEVLTHYGPLFEVWFDGANGEGPNGRKQVYDWPAFIATVHKYQPHAVIFNAGTDIRWVGNEDGYADPTNWCMMRLSEAKPGAPPSGGLGSGDEDGDVWMPAECDVSIRPGWFYRSSEDSKVKTVAELMDIYDGSVGRNGSLLLNVPPDKRGLINEIDAARLLEFRKALDARFDHDLARGRPASATSVRGNGRQFAAANAVSGRKDRYWATNDGIPSASLTVDLGTQESVSTVVLREYIPLGQRVRSFTVDALMSGGWRTVGEGTTIGHERILRIPPTTASRFRLTIRSARACPCISGFALYGEP